MADFKLLGAMWGFTRPFERIWRFWRIDFLPNSQKSANFENRVKSDSRRLLHLFLRRLALSVSSAKDDPALEISWAMLTLLKPRPSDVVSKILDDFIGLFTESGALA